MSDLQLARLHRFGEDLVCMGCGKTWEEQREWSTQCATPVDKPGGQGGRKSGN